MPGGIYVTEIPRIPETDLLRLEQRAINVRKDVVRMIGVAQLRIAHHAAVIVEGLLERLTARRDALGATH